MRRMLALAALVVACGDVRADEGFDAELHVEGAEFRRESIPAATGGPAVRTVTVNTVVSAGATGISLTGELDREATAVAIALAGDAGYWILRAEPPTAAAPDAPTFTAALSFGANMRPGPRELVVSAASAEGAFGPPSTRVVEVRERALPEGELVVSLAWDNGADLDLHVVLPNGVELFKRNRTSFEPVPGNPQPPPPDAGYLDFDSNADCVRDGRRAENVVFPSNAPKGRYLVRVDTFSLCGEPAARWRVQALLRGARIAEARGVATEIETRYPHDRGDGVLALEIDVP